MTIAFETFAIEDNEEKGSSSIEEVDMQYKGLVFKKKIKLTSSGNKLAIILSSSKYYTRNWGEKSLNSVFNLPPTGEGNSESEENYYDN